MEVQEVKEAEDSSLYHKFKSLSSEVGAGWRNGNVILQYKKHSDKHKCNIKVTSSATLG